ncbi:uncharacterized protein BX664DRAFT_380722 [Halteromyces radiatus]|uniref:uncharacterized protein n=1 Tax=Halteromyces radiatus TaxID=101107 RepID=UPI00221FD0D6|nr:uncharacterized protein BX664DRAFT_380722 [Halteromyces radiatus]KAI8081778.1 hypothetical protein BX664DRAFT_380722 [Halteromyces radiatus]
MSCGYDWVEIVDPNSNHTFFANPTTGECLWEKPLTGSMKMTDPEGDWWELWDEKTNLPYYYHTQTCVTEWTKPVDKHVVPLIKIQSSSVFSKRMSVMKRDSNDIDTTTTPVELKRNSRSLDLPATSSLRRTLHQRSNSDGKNDSSISTSPTSCSDYSLVDQQNGSSLLSAVLPHSTSAVFRKISTPVRKQSLRSQKSERNILETTTSTTTTTNTGESRPRRLSHFSAFSSFSSKPLRNFVSGRPTSVQTTPISVSQPINNPDAATAMNPIKNQSNLELVSPCLKTGNPLARMTEQQQQQPSLPDGLSHDIKQFAIDGFAKKYFSTHKKGLFRRRVPMNEMLQWTKDSIKKPLIMMNNDLYKDVLKCFKMIQMIMGDRSRPRNTNDIDDYQNILNFGIIKGQMRDEIYVQVCKQLHNNPNGSSIKKGWEILCVISIAFPPSKNLEAYLTNFVQENHNVIENDVNIMSAHVSNKLKRICQRGAKGKVLTAAEINRAREAPFKPSVFGETLPFIMDLQANQDTNLKIPRIVPFLADTVHQLNGQQSEGIFRVPGDADNVTDLRVRIENGNYDASEITDPNVPASLLKYWLRDLADPLIPAELYDTCLAHSEDPVQAINIINQLPETNRRIALYMISFLQEFSHPDVIKVTLMNINNLAMVFAPNFLRCPGESLTTVFENSKYEQIFLRTLIQRLQVSKHSCVYDDGQVFGSVRVD